MVFRRRIYYPLIKRQLFRKIIKRTQSAPKPEKVSGVKMRRAHKRKAIEYTVIFCFGSIMYGLIEIIIRSYTHWTMLLTGGSVFCVLYFLNLSLKTRSFVLRGLIGAAIITAVEFGVGVVANLIFDLDVWDYSSRRGNILGQICPWFSFCWFLLSVASVYVSIFFYWQLNKSLNLHQE